MPLQLSNDQKFPKGKPEKLPVDAKNDLLNLIRRITSFGSDKAVIERFKYNFCKASGEQYSPSSSLSWAETDLEYRASNAASNAATFLEAFVNSCEELKAKKLDVPDHEVVNQILARHKINFRIKEDTLITENNLIDTTQLEISHVEIVERALADAKTLIASSGAANAVDRLHTALHGYIAYLCKEKGMVVSEDQPTAKVFKMLREGHPAFSSTGHRAEEINRLLQGFATSIDAFSTLRNKASLAHANELLDEPEARAAVNCAYTIFRYLQDRFDRAKK